MVADYLLYMLNVHDKNTNHTRIPFVLCVCNNRWPIDECTRTCPFGLANRLLSKIVSQRSECLLQQCCARLLFTFFLCLMHSECVYSFWSICSPMCLCYSALRDVDFVWFRVSLYISFAPLLYQTNIHLLHTRRNPLFGSPLSLSPFDLGNEHEEKQMKENCVMMLWFAHAVPTMNND